jgi:hypothetical protein
MPKKGQEQTTTPALVDQALLDARRRRADYDAAVRLHAGEPGIHTLIGGTAMSRVTPLDVMDYTKPADPLPLANQKSTL